MIKIIRRNQIIHTMSNLQQVGTQLPVIIWVDDIGSYQNNRHNELRIKVQNNTSSSRQTDSFTIRFDNNQKPKLIGKVKLNQSQVNEVIEYVQTHWDKFLAHWNQEITSDELKDLIGYTDNRKSKGEL